MGFSLFARMERITPEQDHVSLYSDFLDLCTMADAGDLDACEAGPEIARMTT